MTEGRTRVMVGLLVLVAHLSAVLWTVLLYARGLILFPQMTTIIALIFPFLATYTGAIMRFFIDHRHGIPGGRRLTSIYVGLSLILPFLFGALILAAISLKAYSSVFESFDDFKHILAIIESTFGLYAGMFLKSLYDLK